MTSRPFQFQYKDNEKYALYKTFDNFYIIILINLIFILFFSLVFVYL